MKERLFLIVAVTAVLLGSSDRTLDWKSDIDASRTTTLDFQLRYDDFIDTYATNGSQLWSDWPDHDEDNADHQKPPQTNR